MIKQHDCCGVIRGGIGFYFLQSEQDVERELNMKKLGMLLAITILVIGLGFYRGWFTLSRPAAGPGSNNVNINLAANPDKMKQDAKLVKDKASTLTGGAR